MHKLLGAQWKEVDEEGEGSKPLIRIAEETEKERLVREINAVPPKEGIGMLAGLLFDLTELVKRSVESGAMQPQMQPQTQTQTQPQTQTQAQTAPPPQAQPLSTQEATLPALKPEELPPRLTESDGRVAVAGVEVARALAAMKQDVARMPAMQEEPQRARCTRLGPSAAARRAANRSLPARVGLEGAPVAWHRPLRERQSELRGELPPPVRQDGQAASTLRVPRRTERRSASGESSRSRHRIKQQLGKEQILKI